MDFSLISPVQLVTLVATLVGIAITLHVMRLRFPSNNGQWIKSIVLLTVLIHVFVFYSALLIERQDFGVNLIPVLQDIFGSSEPFGTWSAVLRLHMVIAIITKEFVSWKSTRRQLGK